MAVCDPENVSVFFGVLSGLLISRQFSSGNTFTAQHNVQCVKQQGQARLLHYFYFLEKEQDNQEKFPCICKSFEPQLQFFGMTMANCSRISN